MALLGSVAVVGLAFAMAVPVGLVAGVFIAEVGRNSPWLGPVRFVVDVLSGVPAVVVGVFVFFLVGENGRGLFAGALALGVLTDADVGLCHLTHPRAPLTIVA